MSLYIAKNIDIDDFFKDWSKDNDIIYKLSDSDQNYILISKSTRMIINNGFTTLIQEWLNEGILTDINPNKDFIIFPQTIGNITFCSSEELIDWVISKQNSNFNVEEDKQ